MTDPVQDQTPAQTSQTAVYRTGKEDFNVRNSDPSTFHDQYTETTALSVVREVDEDTTGIILSRLDMMEKPADPESGPENAKARFALRVSVTNRTNNAETLTVDGRNVDLPQGRKTIFFLGHTSTDPEVLLSQAHRSAFSISELNSEYGNQMLPRLEEQYQEILDKKEAKARARKTIALVVLGAGAATAAVFALLWAAEKGMDSFDADNSGKLVAEARADYAEQKQRESRADSDRMPALEQALDDRILEENIDITTLVLDRFDAAAVESGDPDAAHRSLETYSKFGSTPSLQTDEFRFQRPTPTEPGRITVSFNQNGLAYNGTITADRAQPAGRYRPVEGEQCLDIAVNVSQSDTNLTRTAPPSRPMTGRHCLS